MAYYDLPEQVIPPRVILLTIHGSMMFTRLLSFLQLYGRSTLRWRRFFQQFLGIRLILNSMCTALSGQASYLHRTRRLNSHWVYQPPIPRDRPLHSMSSYTSSTLAEWPPSNVLRKKNIMKRTQCIVFHSGNRLQLVAYGACRYLD